MKKYNHALFHETLEKTLTEKEKNILHEAVNIPSLQIGHQRPETNYQKMHARGIINFLELHIQKIRAERDSQKEAVAIQKDKALLKRVKSSYNKGFRQIGVLSRKIRKAFEESMTESE